MEYPGRLKSPTVYKCSAPVFSSKFYPSVNRSLLVSCDESGNVTFNNVSTGEVCSRWQAHNNAVFDFSWLPGDLERLVTVSGDQTAVLWDAEVKCRLSLFHGHNRSVKVISTLPDDKSNRHKSAGVTKGLCSIAFKTSLPRDLVMEL